VAVIPFVNGSYATGLDFTATTFPNCVLPANTTTVPCYFPETDLVPADFYGYLFLSDIAVDSSGNLYVVAWTGCYLGCNNGAAYGTVIEYNGTTGVNSLLVDQFPLYIPNGYYDTAYNNFALAQNGDIYYTDFINLYYSAAGTGTFTTISGFNAPTGVSSDSGGNIYVTDTGNNRIAVLPNLNGTVTPSSAYTILSGSVLNKTPYFSVGVDGYGNLSYAATSNSNVFYKASVGGLNFGSIAVGSSTTATDLDLYFTAAATFGSFTFTGNGGASPFSAVTNGCVQGTAYAIGSTCSVTIKYTATAVGPQSGTLQAYSSTGALLGTARLSGSGVDGLLTVDPGTQTTIGSGWNAPSAIATDAAGNTYVTDSTTGNIYKNGSATPIVTGLSAPSAVVVDGAGDLYVAENSSVVEVPYSGTAYGTTNTILTGLSGTTGLAIDAEGNLYVADSGNGRVLLVAAGGGLEAGSNISYVGSSVTSTGTLDPGFTTPVAVAADNLGNVYVADTGTSEILQVGIASGVITTIAPALNKPSALAVDPGGSLYYADSGAGTITRVPNGPSGVTGAGATIPLPATVVASPSGLAFDQSGNLYVVDTKDALVEELNRTAGLLAFGDVVKNVASSPLTATLVDSGTAAVLLGTPYYVASGTNSADFTVQSSSTCTDADSLAIAATCNVSVEFETPNTDTESAELTFTSSGGTPVLNLTGTGVVLVNATITGPTSVAYGTPGSFTVSVTPNIASSYTVDFVGTPGTYTTTVTIGSNSSGTFQNAATLPVGCYAVSLVGTVTAPFQVCVTQATLTATVQPATRVYGAANPALTCTFSGVVNGDAIQCVGTVASSVNASSAPGTYPITPSIVGAKAADYVIAPPASGSTYAVLTITQATANVSLIDIPASVTSIGTILPGTSIALNATVEDFASRGAAPTGYVTFANDTYTNNIVDIGTPQQLSSSGTTRTTHHLVRYRLQSSSVRRRSRFSRLTLKTLSLRRGSLALLRLHSIP
jgi:sugar lactone lactonase YvrE